MAKKLATIKDEKYNPDIIKIVGAREHNLKNISIEIPKNQLVVFTGVSGSGKSSLAFDTIFHEGQRRYMESFSAYARQFIGDLERPDVDLISGLSPVIAIEQKTTGKNPRSTVGTVTELYDFFRLLYARTSTAYSYNTNKPMVKFSEEEIVTNIMEKFANEKIALLAPIVRGRKGHYRELFEDLQKKGFIRVRIDGKVEEIRPKMQLDRYKIHDIDAVVDRLPAIEEMKLRISQSVQRCLKIGKDLLFVVSEEVNSKKKSGYSKLLMCADTGISYEEPSPNAFSFNSPYGACNACKGLGNVFTIDMDLVINDKIKTINEGAIVPLGEERNASVFQQVQVFAKKHKIKLDTPINKLAETQLNLLLFGEQNINNGLEMDLNDDTIPQAYTGVYEGIINMLKRWFSSSQSTDVLKDWVAKFMEHTTCKICDGQRLKKESLWFKIDDKNIATISNWDLQTLTDWINTLDKKLKSKQAIIAHDILKEIKERLGFLMNVGLGYLTLNRPSGSLSGGESQRIKLATQIGSQLQGITYILDEPSIGLHQRDNKKLITALQNLRNLGNSVLVVEHDKDIMLAADYLVDIGPKAGVKGGHIVAAGIPNDVLKLNTATSNYLNGIETLKIPDSIRKGNGLTIELKGAKGHNLKNVNATFPLGNLILVSGVSGSGKSTLINDTLYPILNQYCYHSKTKPLEYKSVDGIKNIDKVIEIDQAPIGRTPRSNPATYCGFFTDIRTLFAAVPESKIRGYTAGRFSFNVKTGRCEMCEGGGRRVIEMNFLPDVHVLCEKCNGKRYNRETLEIRYKGKSISDVLDMSVDDAVDFFNAVPYIYRKIKVLQEVGLGYITLGQSAVTLSGGEAQRVKLSTELGKKDTGKTFYILDEPTTGLHFQDIKLLMDVLQKLVDRGNTVLIIEHNLDVIKMADYIIDIGPEGGNGGGKILYQGEPKGLLKVKESLTAPFLKIEFELENKG